jgi:DNA topoisomerase VI subunit A
MNDEEAKEELLEFFQEKRDIGYDKVDIVDVMLGTGLPPEQINRIVEQLEEEFNMPIQISTDDDTDYDEPM